MWFLWCSSGSKDAFWWEGRSSFSAGLEKRTGGEPPHGKKATGGRFVLYFWVKGLILHTFTGKSHSSDYLSTLFVEESRHAQTVFRDKSGRKRNLDAEKEEQRKKDEEKAAKDEKYAQWGKGFVWKAFSHFDSVILILHLQQFPKCGCTFQSLKCVFCRLAQKDMYQQRLEDAVTEAQKPLARHRDDEDLDRMLREQEREGDPMAAMLRRKKEKNTKTKGCCQF